MKALFKALIIVFACTGLGFAQAAEKATHKAKAKAPSKKISAKSSSDEVTVDDQLDSIQKLLEEQDLASSLEAQDPGLVDIE